MNEDLRDALAAASLNSESVSMAITESTDTELRRLASRRYPEGSSDAEIAELAGIELARRDAEENGTGTDSWEWIMGPFVSATKVAGAVWLLEGPEYADGLRRTMVLSVAEEGRYLLNGRDVEMDERVWGLGDELQEIATVLGIRVRLSDDDEEPTEQPWEEDPS